MKLFSLNLSALFFATLGMTTFAYAIEDIVVIECVQVFVDKDGEPVGIEKSNPLSWKGQDAEQTNKRWAEAYYKKQASENEGKFLHHDKGVVDVQTFCHSDNFQRVR